MSTDRIAVDIKVPNQTRYLCLICSSWDSGCVKSGWLPVLFKGDKSVDETVLEWGMSHPLGKGRGRVCTVDEVAEVIVFLLSDRASFVSGDEIKVDGALLAGVAVVLPE